MLHTQSPRANGPFLRVNCGAIPAELIDSQLFGHERGAFTGAVEARQGWFERASGGTLLLDEVGELPLAAQVRLLRILQDGWMERVGGQEPLHVDVRIVAATHRDLAAMVAEGQFREDLWYRIAVFPIRLPPLRERPEDIPAMARHFAERAAVRFVLPEAPLTAADIQLLTAYPWPGNVRELGAVIDRAAILGNGKRLDVAQALGASERPPAIPPTVPPQHISPASGEILSLDAAMKRHIESVLAVTHGRIEGRRGAAALLKINPHTLRARMRKLGIDWANSGVKKRRRPMTQNFAATSASTEVFAVVVPSSKPQTQEGRILAALGLLRGPLPHATPQWLVRYCDYLAARLCLPFDARCPEDTGVVRPWTSNVTVVEILAPADHPAQDGTGLKCKALRGAEVTEIPLINLEVEADHPNLQLIEDYWYWFWNWQFDPKI